MSRKSSAKMKTKKTKGAALSKSNGKQDKPIELAAGKVQEVPGKVQEVTAPEVAKAPKPVVAKVPTAPKPVVAKVPTAPKPVVAKVPTAPKPVVAKVPTVAKAPKLAVAKAPTIAKTELCDSHVQEAQVPTAVEAMDEDPIEELEEMEGPKDDEDDQAKMTEVQDDPKLEDWTVGDVSLWLGTKGFALYEKVFIENEVDGALLATTKFSVEILCADLGVKRLHANKMLRSLCELQDQQGIEFEAIEDDSGAAAKAAVKEPELLKVPRGVAAPEAAAPAPVSPGSLFDAVNRGNIEDIQSMLKQAEDASRDLQKQALQLCTAMEYNNRSAFREFAINGILARAADDYYNVKTGEGKVFMKFLLKAPWLEETGTLKILKLTHNVSSRREGNALKLALSEKLGTVFMITGVWLRKPKNADQYASRDAFPANAWGMSKGMFHDELQSLAGKRSKRSREDGLDERGDAKKSRGLCGSPVRLA